MAAQLQASGEDVRLLDYRPRRAAHLQAQGIHLITLEGEEKHFPVQCASQAEDIGPCDLAVMLVKAYQTRTAARGLPLLLSGGGMALTLQNGIGNLEQMAECVGMERLLAGVIIAGVTLLDWGRIRLAGQGPIILGIPPGSQIRPAKLQSLLSLLHRAGLECREAEDIIGALWDKLMLNIGINPLTALIRVANGDLLTVPEAWDLAAAAVREGAAVARALNIALSADPVARLRQVCQATTANHSSMLQDVLAGRPTEIAALNGQIVSRGQDQGLPTPVNTILTQLIRAVEQSYPRRARPSANP